MNEEYFSAECPICCYTASGRDELRVETRVEDHMDEVHPDSLRSLRIIVTQVEG